MQEGDVFFTLVGPLGPEDDFFQYQEYWEKTIREMELDSVLQGISEAHEKYARWLNDVKVVGIEYMKSHPEHERVVHQALIEVGLDPDIEDEESH